MRTTWSSLARSAMHAAFGAALAVCAGSMPAGAAVLFSQSPQDGGVGLESSIGAGLQNADDFSLGSAASLEQIRWWGSYVDDQGDDFTVRLIASDGSAPSTSNVLQEYPSASVVRTATAMLDENGAPVYEYLLTLITPVDLTAGVKYLSIGNDASRWFWLTSASAGNGSWNRVADEDDWVAGDLGLAFQLIGTPSEAPEPAVPALLLALGLGLTLVQAGARSRKS